MVKRVIKETVSEYDKDGNLVRVTTTETTEDDDSQYYPYYPTYPQNPWITWNVPAVTCKTNAEG